MINPYPCRCQLIAEARTDAVMAAQIRDEQSFHTALVAFANILDGLQLPLGSPVIGYDLGDIHAVIADLQIRRVPTEIDEADVMAEARLAVAGL